MLLLKNNMPSLLKNKYDYYVTARFVEGFFWQVKYNNKSTRFSKVANILIQVVGSL